MRWRSHVVFGISAGMFLDSPPEAYPLLVLGTVFPDKAEAGVIPHRTITHSLLLWTLLFLGFRALLGIVFSSLPEELLKSAAFFTANAVQGFFVGALSHLLADSLTITGVPIFLHRPRVAFRFFRTGSTGEDVFVAVVFGIAAFLKLRDLLF